jgi:hypothetical protein
MLTNVDIGQGHATKQQQKRDGKQQEKIRESAGVQTQNDNK